MKRITTTILRLTLILCAFAQAYAQNRHPEQSPHQAELAHYKQWGDRSEAEWDALRLHGQGPRQTNQRSGACPLNKQVYGWHPYWMGTAYNNYDFSLLSTFSYFSYELVPSTGSYSSIHSWKTTPSINLAKAAGCRVELCVTNFGSTENTTFLGNTTAWARLTDSLVALVNYRQAHGVNIDFEGVPSAQRTNLTNFMQYLCNRMHIEVPGSTVSMAIYSVDWNSVFDIPNLANCVDAFIIMGYGYHYSGSSSAGPNDPLYHGSIWGTYTLGRSVDYYLNQGCPASKLLIGLPYYGQEWTTTSSSIPASTTGFVSSRTYTYIRDNYIGTYSPTWDDHSKTQAIIYSSGGNWRQCWYDDELTLGERYDMVRDKKIGGIGIWALGYDDGYAALWDLIEERLTDCYVPCKDFHYDTGGNLGQYLNNEDHVATFSDGSNSNVRLNFTQFDVEANFDYVYIHDGFDTAAPLIGTYTGTALPPTITSTGNALTLHFTSDGATRGDGWAAEWSVLPKTEISLPTECFADDFTASFTDTEFCGNGLAKRFYLPTANNGTEERANKNNGFFFDNFNDNALHADWTASTGTWAETGSLLQQTDEGNSNTNIYASLAENASSTYLYHWKMKMEGGGTNRRAGIHFFCDNPSLPNRGNSYFVYFRVDSDLFQIYKVVSDSWTLAQQVALAVEPARWYDCKITYDPSAGKISAWRDDVFITSWTDAAPYTTGGGISPRTGNCIAYYDDIKVYKSRNATATVSVGASSTNDIQYQNAAPNSPSAHLYSLALDNANTFSNPASSSLNIDWTAPGNVAVNDGLAADEDLTASTTTLSANWSASTAGQSTILRYWYQIGTSPLAADVAAATDNGTATSFTRTDLTLAPGVTYYVTVWGENCAGLLSAQAASDGITVEGSCSPSMFISTDYTSSENLSFAVSDYIRANNTLGSGTQIVYSATNQITLEDGFHAQAGSDFHALIQGCAPPALRTMGKASATLPWSGPSIFPNPSEGRVNIAYLAQNDQRLKVELLDMSGRSLASLADLQLQKGETALLQKDLGAYGNGLFLLRFTSDKGETIVRKLVLCR
jgi:spore germination protein YaaH